MPDRDRRTVGILAGGGPLPGRVADAVRRSGRDVFVIAFEGAADPAVVSPFPHLWARPAAAGRILAALRDRGCGDLVLIGPVRRPAFRDLRPDAEGARLLARLGRAFFSGDDGLLGAIVRVLDAEGFRVLGAHEFLRDAGTAGGGVAAEGVLGRHAPDDAARADITRAVAVLRLTGDADVGQACVVQAGAVLALEAIEGTDRMLGRVGALALAGPGGVLVKMPKPRQDRRADLPTIGAETVRAAAAAGLRGVAVAAGLTLVTDPAAMIETADGLGLFVVGLPYGRADMAPPVHDPGDSTMSSYLHTMVRVRDLERSIRFYTGLLGMREIRRNEVPDGRYTLAFVGYDDNAHGQAEIELTYNWDQASDYEVGSGFGHFAVGVPDVAAACEQVRAGGGKVTREAGPVKFGKTVIAFVEDPDGYKIELIERA